MLNQALITNLLLDVAAPIEIIEMTEEASALPFVIGAIVVCVAAVVFILWRVHKKKAGKNPGADA